MGCSGESNKKVWSRKVQVVEETGAEEVGSEQEFIRSRSARLQDVEVISQWLAR